MTAVLEVEEASCRLGRVQALERVSLRAEPGEVVGLVGPNGAGKTTLVETICGLRRPQSGSVRVLGTSMSRDAAAVRRAIGLLPQETALYTEVSAWQNLRLMADLYGVPDAGRRIANVLELVGLAARGHDRVGTLSGGLQRRVAIARALLHDPPLLILDGPTLGVDLDARHQIWDHVRHLRARGRTVVLTTNYLDEAEALCDRVVLLRDGRVAGEDTPAGLVRRAGRCLELESEPAAQMLLLAPRPLLALVVGRLLGGCAATGVVLAILVGFGVASGSIAPPAGHWPALAVLLASVTLMAVSLGVAVGTAVRGSRLVTMVSLNLATYLFFPGGGFTTIAFLPAWLQTLSLAVPTSYAIAGLRQTLFYPDLAGLGVDLAALGVSAALACLAAAAAVRTGWRRA